MHDFKNHWEQVYANRSPLEVSWFQEQPALSLQLIANAGLALDAPIIDVGGGASRLVDHLLERGYSNLSVLDISGRALEHARARLGERAAAVSWHEADVTAFVPPRQYALWHDRAVFHFLTDPAARRRYLAVLQQALPPGGQLAIAAFAPGGPSQCSGLDIVQYDTAKLGAELGPGFQLLEETGEVHMTPAGKEQKFGFWRFLREA